MEAPIYKSPKLELDFIILQPIILKDIEQRKLLEKRTILPEQQWLKIMGKDLESKEKIEKKLADNELQKYWYTSIYEKTNYDLYLLTEPFSLFNKTLKAELSDSDCHLNLVKIPGIEVNYEHTGFAFVFDTETKSFMINFHIGLLFDPTNGQYDQLSSLFKAVRDIAVKDDARRQPGEDQHTRWAEKIKTFCMQKVKQSVGIKPEEMIIEDSSGYTLSFCSEKQISKIPTDKLALFQEQILANNATEDIDREGFPELPPQLSLNAGQYFIFLGWLYSTIYGLSEKKLASMLPSLFLTQTTYIQFNYFYTDYTEKIVKNIRYDFDVVNSNKYIMIYDTILVSLESVKQSHSKLKARLKNWQLKLHEWLWFHWHLEPTYTDLVDNLNSIESSMERKMAAQNDSTQNTQNNILFVLGLLQLFTIAGMVSDYFGLFELDIPNDLAGSIQSENLISFRNSLPLTTLILSVLFIIIVYRKLLFGLLKKAFTTRKDDRI